MSKIKLLCLVLAIVFGAFLFVYGGYDDSPGAQGLGLVIVTGSVVGIVRSVKKQSKQSDFSKIE